MAFERCKAHLMKRRTACFTASRAGTAETHKLPFCPLLNAASATFRTILFFLPKSVTVGRSVDDKYRGGLESCYHTGKEGTYGLIGTIKVTIKLCLEKGYSNDTSSESCQLLLAPIKYIGFWH